VFGATLALIGKTKKSRKGGMRGQAREMVNLKKKKRGREDQGEVSIPVASKRHAFKFLKKLSCGERGAAAR